MDRTEAGGRVKKVKTDTKVFMVSNDGILIVLR